MTRKLEAERAELMAKNQAATSWGAAVGARSERIKAIDRELSRLAAAPLGDVREALELIASEQSDSAMPWARGVARAAIDALVPAGGEALSEALECLQSIADMKDNDPREPDDADWRFRALEAKRAAQCTIAALAPQNAGGERQPSSDGGFKVGVACEMPRTCRDGQHCYGHCKTASGPSEATPAPAKCGCGEFCQDLGVDSGCRYISNPPAPADDEPLSDRDHAMIDQAWENYKAAVPVATVINDNQPGRTAIIKITIDPPTLPVGTKLYAGPKMVELPPAPADDAAVAWQTVPKKATAEMIKAAYNTTIDGTTVLFFKQWEAMLAAAPTRPAKAVDVEAICAKMAEWADDFEAAAHEVPRGIKATILMTRAQEVRALLRDSNASSDKGGR
jgi:hypothetical protein